MSTSIERRAIEIATSRQTKDEQCLLAMYGAGSTLRCLSFVGLSLFTAASLERMDEEATGRLDITGRQHAATLATNLLATKWDSHRGKAYRSSPMYQTELQQCVWLATATFQVYGVECPGPLKRNSFRSWRAAFAYFSAVPKSGLAKEITEIAEMAMGMIITKGRQDWSMTKMTLARLLRVSGDVDATRASRIAVLESMGCSVQQAINRVPEVEVTSVSPTTKSVATIKGPTHKTSPTRARSGHPRTEAKPLRREVNTSRKSTPATPVVANHASSPKANTITKLFPAAKPKVTPAPSPNVTQPTPLNSKPTAPVSIVRKPTPAQPSTSKSTPSPTPKSTPGPAQSAQRSPVPSPKVIVERIVLLKSGRSRKLTFDEPVFVPESPARGQTPRTPKVVASNKVARKGAGGYVCACVCTCVCVCECAWECVRE
jgi:hypothetical protein